MPRPLRPTTKPPAPVGVVARLLARAARAFAREALGFVHARGHGAVSEVLLALFRNLDLDGTRLTEIAARARMTKQSMRELVDRAEALGLVARQPDRRDQRAKTIRFTPAGLAMLAEMRRGIAEAEAHFAATAGADFLATLKARLTAYAGVDRRLEMRAAAAAGDSASRAPRTENP